MQRVVVYAREADLNILENRADVLSYFSRELKKRCRIRIKLTKEKQYKIF